MRFMVPIVFIPGAVSNQDYPYDFDQTTITTFPVTLTILQNEFN